MSKMTVRQVLAILMAAVFAAGLAGCGKSSGEETLKPSKNQIIGYYVSRDTTRLVPRLINIDKSDGISQQIAGALKSITDVGDNIEYRSVLPEDVVIQSWGTRDNGTLSIDLNSSFYNASNASQMLCRAGLVETLTQIKGVDNIMFTVDTQAMVIGDSAVGALTADSFAESRPASGENHVQDVTLYFSDYTGEKLQALKVPMNLDGKISAEQKVVERLIRGTNEKGYKSTIPENTRLLSVSTRDGVCYVNFSDDFLKVTGDVKDQVIIYSVVNSLCDLSNVKQVAFFINGEQQKLYNGNITFDQPFDPDLDLVE